jgi:hypothetical protein
MMPELVRSAELRSEWKKMSQKMLGSIEVDRQVMMVNAQIATVELLERIVELLSRQAP